MNGRESRALSWLPPWWGLGWLIIFVVAILVILWWIGQRPKDGEERATPAPAQAIAECDRQLSSSTFRIDASTAHERYLVDYPVPTSKRPLYIYVVFKKSNYSFGGPVQTPASADKAVVTLNANRPSDLDHLSNTSADDGCVRTKLSSGSTGGSGYSEERWSTYCDLTQYQYEDQERNTGLMKYRVQIQNWSDEAVDYCFVASCNVRYPSGKPCSAPVGTGSPYSAPGYSAPSSSSPPGYSAPGYSAPTASAPPAAVPATGQ